MKNLINTLLLALLIGVTLTAQSGYKVGDTAADFSLKGVDGKMHSLADMKEAKGFVVTFTCNHCPYAIMYEDRLVALQEEFGPKGYQVVAINPNDPAVKPDDSFDNMIIRAEEKKFNFPYLMDEGQKLYPIFGATKTPHVFLLDSKLEVKYIGAIDDNARNADEVDERFLANAINALEAGKNPDPSMTKAIGCSIKTK